MNRSARYTRCTARQLRLRSRILYVGANLGTNESDRLAEPSWMIWPSDHAGLALHVLPPAAE